MQNNAMGNAYDILDRLFSMEGLYERIFGKLLDPLVYSEAIDHDIHIIGTVYGYTDAKESMNRLVERKEFKGLSSILFRFSDVQQQGGGGTNASQK